MTYLYTLYTFYGDVNTYVKNKLLMIVCALTTLFSKIAEEEGKKKTHPLRVKKMYVLAAEQVQEHNLKMKETMREGMWKLLFIFI